MCLELVILFKHSHLEQRSHDGPVYLPKEATNL